MYKAFRIENPGRGCNSPPFEGRATKIPREDEGKLKDYHLPVFQKLWLSDTCNQVKIWQTQSVLTSRMKRYHSLKEQKTGGCTTGMEELYGMPPNIFVNVLKLVSTLTKWLYSECICNTHQPELLLISVSLIMKYPVL